MSNMSEMNDNKKEQQLHTLQVPGDMQERFSTFLAIRLPMKAFKGVKPPRAFLWGYIQ